MTGNLAASPAGVVTGEKPAQIVPRHVTGDFDVSEDDAKMQENL